jgi:DNA-binding protein YbaB
VDVQAARRRAEGLLAAFEKVRDGHDELQRTLLSVTATATSPDGTVTVTVGPRGHVVRVDLDPRIYRRPDAARLAESVTETIQRATAAATAQVLALARPYLPDPALQADLRFDFARVLETSDHELTGGEPRWRTRQ